MNKQINWGMIGLGKIARRFAEDLMRSKHSKLQGVASRDINKAKEFGSTFNSVRCYGSYEELACDPDIDVVYIATPHAFHHDHTMICLKNDKAVLCEKPMGINAGEVKSMAEEARSRNLFLMEAVWTRFIPATAKLLELIQNGVIGDLSFIRADFGFRSAHDPESRLYNKALGGGSLLDIGIYPVYLSLLTLGIPTEIKAMARITETDVDSYCSMLLSYENGAKAVLESTIEADTPTEAYLHGSRGSLKLHSRFHHSEKITISGNGEEEILDIKYQGNGLIYEIEEVNSCLLQNRTESSKLPLQTSLNLITVLDHIKKEIGLSYSS